MPNSLPVDYHRGYRHPFIFGVHYLGGVGDVPRTLTDLAMSAFSAELRRKPEWWKRYLDESERCDWSLSAKERQWTVETPSSSVSIQLNQNQINYVLGELAGYAALRDEEHGCQVSCFERIWESDSLLDDTTSSALIQELSKLRRDSSGAARDEDGVTVNLIDPMLYCLVYNRTLVSTSPNRIPKPVAPPCSSDVYSVSSKFALLPSEVFISPDGNYGKFLSYINNLHPDRYSELYGLIEKLLARFIPLFEHTLTDLHRNNPLTQRIPGTCRYTVWDEPDPPEFSDDEEGWANYERDMRQWIMNRPIQLPEVSENGYCGGLQNRRHTVRLNGRNLQVFTRISDVCLAPAGLEFPGSEWHVEGMRSERVVACGYHYLSCENITPSSLEFRMAVTYPRGFFAGDNGATLRTWGFTDGDACHQYIGSVPIRAGLSVVFPNIYQQQHAPFKLADPSKEGQMTVVSFLLVDPEIMPILSTAAVGPQQDSWLRKAVFDTLNSRLPVELVESILEEAEGLMTTQEAETYRKDFVTITEQFTQEGEYMEELVAKHSGFGLAKERLT